MNDPDDPRADERLEELLAGIEPGDPFAMEVEALLSHGGPVPIDDRDVDAVVASLQARFAANSRGSAPRRRWWSLGGAAAAAAALILVGSLSWMAGQRSAAPTEPDPSDAVAEAAPGQPSFGQTQVTVGDGAITELDGDTVVLVDGVVSIARTDPRQTGAHRVRVSAMDLTVEPVGTVYFVGTRDDLAAVWVREGRVRLMHQTQGHLGEVTAGSWALVSGTGVGLELHRVPDGPFDPAEVGLGPEAGELLADMRWMALPEGARAAILTAGDGD